MIFRIIFVLFFIIWTVSLSAFNISSPQNPQIKLYAVKTQNKTDNDPRAEKVTIQYFIPEKQSGSAVIICPGGGYYELCDTYEGEEVARWLNSLGISAILLRYRTGENLNAAPLDDVLNAICYVRKNADLYGIDSNKIGIIGFSAGGHLAANAAVYGKNESAVNFHILIYPVISLNDQWTHKVSRQNFLGTLLNEENIQKYSAELNVSSEISSAFVCHSATDRSVPVQNSRMYVDALQKHNVSVTYLELPKGGHGFGSGKSQEWKIWQNACEKWLKENNLIIINILSFI